MPISLPHTEFAVATYYIICTAEASSNLARYDGVKYGMRVDGKDIIDMYKQTRSAGFGKEVKRRIILGTYVLSSGYYDAYYRKAGQVRTLIRRDFDKAFEQCDVIVTPVSPTTAFKIGEKTEDPLTMYLSDIFTIPVNLAGLPAISLPCGFDGKGLPIGLSDHREASRRNASPAGGLSPGGGEKAEKTPRYVRVTMDTLDPQRFLSALLHMGIDRYVSGGGKSRPSPA